MKLKDFSSALALTAALFSVPAAQADDSLHDSYTTGTQVQLPAEICDAQLSTLALPPQAPALLLQEWNDWEDWYQPFATYSISPEEQAAYLALIQEFWPGVYDDMQPWEINDEMADVINTMVETIADCSQGLATVNSFVGAVKTFRDTSGLLNPNKWAKFIKNYKDDLLQGLGLLRYNRRHKHCITVASANWRTTFEMAYGQYWW